MRIEAHIKENKLALFVQDAGGYDQANDVRRAVDASRYSRRFSNRDDDLFCFLYPLTVDKCREMRQAFGSELKVTKGLSAWFREETQRRIEQVARTRKSDASLTFVPALYPRLNTWLKGDQRVTAQWIANAYRRGGLLADEVGTGKTVGVVAGLVEAQITGDTLIVCPKISVRSVWLREIKRHTDIPVYACYGNRKRREKVIEDYLNDTSKFKILIVVAEMLRVKVAREKGRITEFFGYEYPDLFEMVSWSAVVIDESHKVLGAMDVVKGNLAGEGIRRLNYAPHPLRLAVTATPFGKGGRTEALFGTLHWLWPDEFTSRWAWLRKYFEVFEENVFVRGGRGATKTVQRVGDIDDEPALWVDLGPRVLRRTMEDVSPEHRGLKNWAEVLCDMEAGQARQYAKFAQDAELAVDGGIISSVGVLDFITRCRQLANGALRKEGGRVVYTGLSGKVDALLHRLDNLAPGRKVVIASQYNEFLDVVEKRLADQGYGWYRLDGGTTDTERERIMGEFQGTLDPRRTPFTGRIPGKRDNVYHCPGCGVARKAWHEKGCSLVRETSHNIFLLNTQAGGVSITLDAADELHALDETDPNTMTQLFGRIFRRGRVHKVFFYTYRSVGTIDEQLGFNVADRQAKQARLLDGRRGKEYAKEIAQYRGAAE